VRPLNGRIEGSSPLERNMSLRIEEYIQFHKEDGTVIYVKKTDKEKIREYREDNEYYEYHELSL